MILKTRQAGEMVLRRIARPLSPEEIVLPATHELIASMFQTMRDAPGVGLAAPQVGVPVQLAVIEDRQEYIDKLPPAQAAERGRWPVPSHVIINPKLTIENAGEVQFFEGCLSLAGFTAIVPRARVVKVECLNEHAEQVTIRAQDWYARILQHEIDHLFGTLYIDRMLARSFMTRENFERHWKDVSASEYLQAIAQAE